MRIKLFGFCMLLIISISICAAQLPDFTDLVIKNKPTVVSVEVTKRVESYGKFEGFDQYSNPEFEDFLRRFFGWGGPQPPQQPQQPRESVARGSGFIISDDGYVLTNHHVIQDADKVIVRLSDRREVSAEIIGADRATDIALLKIDEKKLPAVEIGNSDALQAGQWVMAIGSPFNFDYTVTAGIISATGRSFIGQQYIPFIQTDVAINRGNSGGPLINMDGEVIGINSQIFSSTGGYIGLSFAIPIEVAMDVVDQLREDGKVARGYLGVVIGDVTADTAEFWGLDKAIGALVSEVQEDSPAAEAGIKPGDIIVEFNGEEIIEQSVLPPAVGKVRPGNQVKIKLMRDKRKMTVTAKIDELPNNDNNEEYSSKSSSKNYAKTLGLLVENIETEKLEELDIDGGVLIKQVKAAAARKVGLQAGDIILMIGSETIKNIKEFKKILEKIETTDSVPLLVKRENRRFYVVVPKEND